MSGVTTAVDLSGEPDASIATRARIDRGEIPCPRLKVKWAASRTGHRVAVDFRAAARDSFTWNVHARRGASGCARKVIAYGDLRHVPLVTKEGKASGKRRPAGNGLGTPVSRHKSSERRKHDLS
jgi:hypothetical protein